MPPTTNAAPTVGPAQRIWRRLLPGACPPSGALDLPSSNVDSPAPAGQSRQTRIAGPKARWPGFARGSTDDCLLTLAVAASAGCRQNRPAGSRTAGGPARRTQPARAAQAPRPPLGHHLIARLQHRFVQHALAAPWGRRFWLPIRIDGRRFVPYFRSRARLDLTGPRAPWPLGTRAEGSSETDDGTHLPPTNRRSSNHSRRVGCRRTHRGHGGAVRLLPGSYPGGLLRLLVPSQAAAVRIVPGLPPAGDGGGADVAPLERSRVQRARDLGPRQ